jgi:hypothetical protein
VTKPHCINKFTSPYVSDPAQWSADDVKSWLVFNLQQFNLPMTVVDYFNMPGSALAQLSEEEFQQRAPQVVIYTYNIL